jgi:hypothetical protein
MVALEAMMKEHNIDIYYTTSSSSHGHALYASSFSFNATSTSSSSHAHALSASSFSFNATSTSSSYEWIIDSGASYHIAKDKTIFYSLNECNTKKIFFGDGRSLSVVGSGTIQIDNGYFNDVLCVPSLSCNLLSVYQITHSSEGKTVDFSPH